MTAPSNQQVPQGPQIWLLMVRGYGLGVIGCEEKEVEDGQRWERCHIDRRLESQVKEKLYNYQSTAKTVVSHPDTENN